MPPSSKQKRIKDLPLSVRPREKLLSSGRENLTNAELLALLFNTGTLGKNVLTLSESLLRKYPLDKLVYLPVNELAAFPGIGAVKAARVIAALELGERVFSSPAMTKTIIRTTEDAVSVLRTFADKKQEYLVALYLNARHELLQQEVVGMGTLNSMRIEPKEIFRHALSTPCAALVVAHNHPSGDSSPSDDDIIFTKRLFEAGEIMGIPLIDHLVLSKTGYFSFSENKTVAR